MTEGIGDKFIKLLPTINDLHNIKNQSYTLQALDKFKTYKTNLNEIKTKRFSISNNSKQNDKNHIKMYILNFLMQIFYKVSNIQYPDRDVDYIMTGVPRANHGTLNMLRSFKFGLWFIRTIHNSLTKKLVKELFPDTKFLVIILLSTIFESIMRIDEQSSFDVLTELNQDYFERLYPNLSYEVFGSIQMSPHQIASSIFYKIIMTECFDYPAKQIEELALAVAFYWREDINNNTIKIKNLTLSNLQKTTHLKFFIYYTIIMFGHYTDHCRCSWKPSQALNEEIFQKVFELFKIPDKKQVEFVKLVIQTMVDTEFEKYQGDISTISNYTKMMNLCTSQLTGQYTENFIELSSSYPKAIVKLNIYSDIDNFLDDILFTSYKVIKNTFKTEYNHNVSENALEKFYKNELGENIINNVEKALRNKNKKAVSQLLDIYSKKHNLVPVGINPLNEILRDANLYNKYITKFNNFGYRNLDIIALYFDDIVKELNIDDDDKLKLLITIKKHKKKFSNEAMTKFSSNSKGNAEIQTIEEYINNFRYNKNTHIHNISFFNTNILNEKMYTSLNHSYNELKTIGDIIDIKQQGNNTIELSPDYTKIMDEHKKLSEIFFEELFDNFKKESSIIYSIIIAFTLYTSSYYDTIKNKLFENHKKLNIYSKNNVKKFVALSIPFNKLFINKSMKLNKRNYISLDINFISSLKLGIDEIFKTRFPSINISNFETLLESKENKLINLDRISDIIISVFVQWEKFLKDKKLDKLKILSFAGTGNRIKQHANRKNYVIKTLESTTYNLTIPGKHGNILKIYITDIKNILNIEIFSLFKMEKEALLFSPNDSYTVYDTKKKLIQISSTNIKKNFSKIYMIVIDNKSLPEQNEKNNKGYFFHNYLDAYNNKGRKFLNINPNNLFLKKKEIYTHSEENQNLGKEQAHKGNQAREKSKSRSNRRILFRGKNSKNMTSNEIKAIKILGFTQKSWNENENGYITKLFRNLTPEQQEAAKTLGYPSGKQVPIIFGKNKKSNYMTQYEKNAIQRLGFTKERWNKKDNSYSQLFNNLTPEQQTAATTLGYQNGENVPILLIRSRKFENVTQKERTAIETLGFSKATWNSKGKQTFYKPFNKLTQEQKNAAITLDYGIEEYVPIFPSKIKTIKLKLLSNNGREIILDFDTRISIGELKNLIQFKYDIPSDSQVLIRQGKQLKNDMILEDNGIIINLMYRNPRTNKSTGGGKKTSKVVSKSSNKKLNNKKADYVIKIVNGRKRKVFTGPKGGKYIISKNKKIYI